MSGPTIGIKTTTNNKNLIVGRSKIGGKPHLPKDFRANEITFQVI